MCSSDLIGPSAHSYNGASRQFNVTSNGKYLKSIQQNMVPFSLENLTKIDQEIGRASCRERV